MYKTIPTFMPNAGIVLNAPQEFLPANVSPYSRNMEFFNQLLQTRLGLVKFDTAVLSGPVQRQYNFRISLGTIFYMFFTTKDIYSYDFANLRYDILTPLYTTGTIEVQIGTPTILRGTGTLFLANVKVGDYVKIGAGAVHTGSTWYLVTAVTDNTHLTVSSSMPTTGAGSAYVVRKTFTGTVTSPWFCKPFVDSALGDMLIATNGADAPIYYTGSGQVSFIARGGANQLPAGFIAKYLVVYKSRVVWLWCNEGGINNKKRIRYSGVASYASYQAVDFQDLLDEDTEIRGGCIFDDYLMIGKEKEWYVGRPDPTVFVFQFSKSSTAEGLKSQGSVIVRKDYVYYYGFDKKMHRWNVIRDEVLTEEIFEETRNFDQNLEQYIEGFDFYPKNQIRWLCPYVNNNGFNNYIVVYDYRYNKTQVWDCASTQAICSIGSYILQADLYLDDAIWGEYYLDEQDGYFDDVTFLANAPVFLYCGYDGIVRKCDIGADDDGNAYTRLFRSTRNNYSMPNQFKRLWKQQFWFVEDPVANITLKMKKDDSTSYESLQPTITLVDDTKDIVKLLIEWNKEGQDFQIELSSTSFFALLGWVSYVMSKRKIGA